MNVIRFSLAFALAVFVVPVLSLSAPAWAQQEIAGRYKLKGTEIVHTITIPQQRPAAVIASSGNEGDHRAASASSPAIVAAAV